MGKRLMLLLVAITLIMGSCKKDSDSVTKMGANIDGKNWNAGLLRLTNLTGNVFSIVGTSLTGEVLEITINGNTPGVYELNLTKQECLAIYKKGGINTSPSDFFTSVSGKVNLTKVDLANKKISGTFDFNCAQLSLQTVIVSNGSFNDLSYTETPL